MLLFKKYLIMSFNKSDFFTKSIQERINYLKLVKDSKECLIPSVFSLLDFYIYIRETGLFLKKPNGYNKNGNLIISKGHAASVFYLDLHNQSQFASQGFGEDGSSVGIYANLEIDNVLQPSGSLGHGVGVACGILSANKNLNTPLFVIVGDGECFEGSIWEAITFASAHELRNLVIVVDANKRCILGDIDKILPLGNLENKFKGFGCDVLSINGHNYDELSKIDGFLNSDNSLPKTIILNTVKGKGITFMEESPLWHNRHPGKDVIEELINEFQKELIDAK